MYRMLAANNNRDLLTITILQSVKQVTHLETVFRVNKAFRDFTKLHGLEYIV